ncbi:alpha/beta hydrolase family protein [Glycomyces lechevalierae]|uniref:Dienelactone hydrolase n=1 Tax=Glycomyces lechevalierae TaxID=256034 RepID=A0A9X3PI98_9ACTN|nr:prolyl oligopeptidase family serine peptidase [Glycomyces lechevalierae]MDA1384183.1 prolyl oligopeptidase family serine peptidase [Glycomyces lechevalierae]MDR7339387.1 dienelactone hydrolase [Glycomyces lechevalierae]
MLVAWGATISSFLPLSDSVLFLAEDELEGEGVRVWSESLRPTRLRVLDLETDRIRTLGEEHAVAVAQRPDGGPLAVITWPSPELDPGALEPRLSLMDVETGAVRDLGRAGIEASPPVWWQGDDGWHVAYLEYPELAGGLAVFDVTVESGEHRNLTADMDACPIELVQAPSGAPWVLVAEGLDTSVRRLGADDILTVAGHAESLAVRGELVAMIASTARQPKEVHCGSSTAPLTAITDLGRELSGIPWGLQERLAYKASDGLSLEEWDDIETGIDLLVAEGVADPDRLGIGGWSHGGFMAAWAVGQTERFKASLMGAGISDWGMLAATGEFGPFEAARGGSVGWEGEGPHPHDRLSPVSHAAKIRTPVLIVHGEDDTNVPLSQAEYFHRALRRFGVEHEFVVYPGEGHSLRERGHQLDLLHRTRDWFDRWLR